MYEKILAEIERLRRKNHIDADNGCNEDECSGYELCLDNLLSFIESLEAEHKDLGEDMNIVFSAISKVCNTLKPEEFARYNETVYKVAMMAVAIAQGRKSLEKEQDVDLDKEIDRFMESVNNEATIDETAKHFYELGCRHAAVLYDDMEKERQRRCEEEQEGLHFTPLGRLIQKLPWNDSTNSYAKKLVDCLIREGYTKDAQIVQEIVSYKNGYNVPMATLDEVHIQFNDKRTLPKTEPQGLDEAPKKDYKKLYEDIVNSDWYKKAYVGKSLGDFIPVEGLDEAAEEIVIKLVPSLGQKYEDGSYVGGIRDFFSREELIGLVKAGAKWQAEQGVSVEGKVVMDFSEPSDIINRRLIAKLGDVLLKVEPGDVRIQITKID